MSFAPSLYVPVLVAFVVVAATYPVAWKLIWPAWKRYGKMCFFLSASAASAAYFGWWSLVFVLGHPLLGLVLHILWCRSHGFDWMNVDAEEYRASQEQWINNLRARRDRAKKDSIVK